MNKVNFLKQEYRIEPPQNGDICGIVDGVDERPAYTTSDTNEKWNAIVKNPDNYTFQFVPVDYNIIIYRENGEKEQSCDGMILVDSIRMISFVELKDVRTGGYAEATITLR